LRGLLIVLGALVIPGVSLAQQYYDPGQLNKAIDRKPVDLQSPGLRLGSFVLNTGAELAYEDKDNIFYRSNSGISDSIIHVRPWANLKSDWGRHELNFNFYANLGRYNDFGNEDYDDWVAGFDGRIDIRRSSNFNYKASYMQLHEDRSSPDDVRGIKPTEYSLSRFDLGYAQTFNRLTAALIYQRADINYDDNINGDGDILNNQDRNRKRDTLTLRFDYLRSGPRSIFFSAAGNNVDYDQVVDDAGFARSSDGYSFRGGVSWDKTGVLVGELYLEYLNQEYDDPRFTNIDGWGFGARLDWTPTERTVVEFLVRNRPQETTQANTSGYFSSQYSVRLQHELRRNWLVNVRISYTDNNYEFDGNNSANALTDTQVIRAGAGLGYLFNRHFYISGGYIYEDQDANISKFDYTTNRWFVTLGAEF